MVRKNGMFIVFEGLDGAGSTTQATLLEINLKKIGYKTALTKEPTVGLMGGLIKAALAGEWKINPLALQLLFSADRAQHVESQIIPALESGKIVISDRYFFSSVAYGAATGVDKDWLLAVNKNFKIPDITFFIDVSPKTSIKRIATGRFTAELFEKEEALTKVREQYRKLAKQFGFKMINGERSIEDISKEIFEIVKKAL